MSALGLHSIVERPLFAALGEWEVRRHLETGREHAYFTSRGFLHLQLWHDAARVSILTPSRLTGDRFEIWRDGIRIRVGSWAEVVARLSGLALPRANEIATLWLWTVVRDETAAYGARRALVRAGA